MKQNEKIRKLSKEDQNLIENLINFLKKHYKKGKHHVAAALVTESGKTYFALHLDIQGFDVCAESICMANALMDNHSKFKKIAAVIMTNNGKIEVVNPCGNCRQMLFSYAPKIQIITNENGLIKNYTIEELLPLPY